MQDLFGNIELPVLVPANKPRKRKSEAAHETLIMLYGSIDGQKCRGCINFIYRGTNRKYPKCKLSGLKGHTQDHDWSGRWAACGKFQLTIKSK